MEREDDDPGRPITLEEMVKMFGEEMPIEAVTVLFNAQPHETIGQIRAKLREVAAEHKLENGDAAS